MKRPFYHVKKRTLLAVAGCVWLAAGVNVARLGIIAYSHIELFWVQFLLSVVVFAAFGFMFFKMSMKHTRRIKGYAEETKPIWNFFDLKAYLIMAFMMGGGIHRRVLYRAGVRAGACRSAVLGDVFQIQGRVILKYYQSILA